MSTILSYRNIHIESKAIAFRMSVFAMLRQLESRPLGKKLVDRIHSCGHCIIIQEAVDESHATPLKAGSSNTEGCPTTIKLYNRAVTAFGKRGQCINIPPYICLAHELIHALHFAHGVEKNGELSFIWTNAEELYTIEGNPNESDCISENAIRKEWNLPERYGHWAYAEPYRQVTCFESRFREIEWIDGSPVLKSYSPRLQRRYEHALIPVLTQCDHVQPSLGVRPEFLLSLMKRYPNIWRSADRQIKRMSFFWIEAVKLQRGNKALLLAALKLGHHNAYYHASRHVQATPEALTLAPSEANSDRELMLELLRINRKAWKWAGIDLYDDVAYWVEAVKECPSDPELIVKAHEHTRGASTRYADSHVLQSLQLQEFVLGKRKRK